MYSYEDRIRAVKLYLKLGTRLTATVRQLGYPTTKSLERWYHKYERCLDSLSRKCSFSYRQRYRLIDCAVVDHVGRSFFAGRRIF